MSRVSISWYFESIPGFFPNKTSKKVFISYTLTKKFKKKIPIIITAGRLRDELKKKKIKTYGRVTEK